MINFNNSKLKERIKASGLKSSYIAQSLGLHKQTISFYLTGKRKPKKETLKEIAKICRCKLGDFYDSQEEVQAREHQDNG